MTQQACFVFKCYVENDHRVLSCAYPNTSIYRELIRVTCNHLITAQLEPPCNHRFSISLCILIPTCALKVISDLGKHSCVD